MKLLMIVIDDASRMSVEDMLARHEVKGYTEIPLVYGEGTHGKRLGSLLHPGASSIVFTVVSADKVAEIKADISRTCQSPQGFHMVVLNVEEFI